MSRWLVISDLQMIAEHSKALAFCKRLAKEYKIPKENILNCGDELDLTAFSLYPRDGNEEYTANQEIEQAKEKIKEWASAFPKMKLCLSNHGLRILKRASHAQIPSQVIKNYHDIFNIPKAWQYDFFWKINAKNPFLIQHGHTHNGLHGARNAAIDNGISVVQGHNHTVARIDFIRTKNLKIWAMSCGALIDKEKHCFNYAKDFRYQACIGTGIILDDGALPIWLPLD